MGKKLLTLLGVFWMGGGCFVLTWGSSMIVAIDCSSAIF